nr:carbohydrate ABC transporter permease [Actinomadura madurae]
MKRLPRRLLLNGTGLLVFLIAVFPVFWMASTAFKPNTEIFSTTPKPLPAHPTLTHFDLVLNGGIAEVSFWEYFRNSAILALVTVLASGLLALMAATAVARFRFRFRTTFLIMLLVVQMVPLEALVIPLFLDLKQLDLLNSLSGLAIVYIGFAVPFAIWMLRGFVAAVPRELEEAAAIDGAARSGRSSPSCSRSSPPAWWRPASSPSSPPGTSSSSRSRSWTTRTSTPCRSCCSSSSAAAATPGGPSWQRPRCSPFPSSSSSCWSSAVWCPASPPGR